ncbi:MAG: TIGR02466 family protein [Bdellovibrionales bacterium]|jgi:uncharacterized protein (TIGR02466 family)|nr:TIGR02466 family protein [Bdellovibrionales bacterium]
MAVQSFFPTLIYQAPLIALPEIQPETLPETRASQKRSEKKLPDRKIKLHAKPPALHRLTKKLCQDLTRESLIIRDIDSDGIEWSEKHYPRGFTSYGSWDTLHERFPSFTELETYLDKHVARFAKEQNWDLGGGRLKMVSCWVNIMPPGAVHSLHLHPLSVVSGTFYASIPKGSSPIKFEDPRLDRFMAQPPRHPSAPKNQQPFVVIEPKEGDVVLFESWIRHEVPPVSETVKSERISISFNYDWLD